MFLTCLALAVLGPQLPAVGPPVPSRLYWFDLDRDGDQDALALDAQGVPHLLRNSGQGTFFDASADAGIGEAAGFAACLIRDVDHDGAEDLVLAGASGLRCYLQTEGRFVDATSACGLSGVDAVHSMGWVDANGDGLADLHVSGPAAHRVFAGEAGGAFIELELGLELRAAAGPFAASGGPLTSDAGGRASSVRSIEVTRSAESVPGEVASAEPRIRTGRAAGAIPGLGAVPSVDAIPASPPLESLSLLSCVTSMTDLSGGSCVQVSSVPTLGMLYPLGSELFIDAATGNVGVGTTAPSYALQVVGQLVSGVNNSAAGLNSALGGGTLNSASGELAGVAGGDSNQATALGAFVGGGFSNAASSERAAIAAGVSNRASYRAFVGGGDTNRALGNTSVVGGGKLNDALQAGAFVGGGESNTVDGVHAAVLGGTLNSVTGARSTIGGGANNTVMADDAVLGGGGSGADPALGNEIGPLAQGGVLGGGSENSLTAPRSVVGGGAANAITGLASEGYGVVAGGRDNRIGGVFMDYGAIGGGESNEIFSADHGTVAGGAQNEIYGDYGAIPGGLENQVLGDFGMAAGRHAVAAHDGAFVWADGTGPEFRSTGPGQFLIRAAGGVGIGTPSPGAALHVQGGGDVSPSGGGEIQAGQSSGQNIGIDGNEIMARDGAATSTLNLNADGGDVRMFNSGPGTLRVGDYLELEDEEIRSNGGELLIESDQKLELRAATDMQLAPSVQLNASALFIELDAGADLDMSAGVNASLSAPGTLTLDAGLLRVEGVTELTGPVVATQVITGTITNALSCPCPPSDIRWKQQIEPLSNVLDRLLDLRGKTYFWNEDSPRSDDLDLQYGFIAQEVQAVFPELVKDYVDGEHLTVNYDQVVPMLVEAVRELRAEKDAEVEALRKQLEQSRRSFEEVAARLERIEASIRFTQPALLPSSAAPRR